MVGRCRYDMFALFDSGERLNNLEINKTRFFAYNLIFLLDDKEKVCKLRQQ